MSGRLHRRLPYGPCNVSKDANPDMLLLCCYVLLDSERFRMRHIKLILCALLVGTFALTRPEQSTAQANRTPFYGINFINMEEAALRAAMASGAGSARWEFGWRSHEVALNAWDWRAADWLIGPLNGSGFETLAMLHDPPDFWEDERGVPINLNLPWDHPDNGWGRFCYQFAERYGPEIPSYEVWNEPDVKQFWGGTAEEYYLLLKTCYQAIKAGDPDSTIVIGSMLYRHDPDFFRDVLGHITDDPAAAANNYYFDVTGLHIYVPSDLLVETVEAMNADLVDAGIPPKPVWITEIGILNAGYGLTPATPAYGVASEDRAAWYLLQAVSESHAVGVERLMWYRWADDFDVVSYGLIRDDLTFRKSYYAFQQAANLIHSIESSERRSDGDLVINEMRRADGARIVTVYALSGLLTEVNLPAVTGQAQVFSPSGEVQQLTADENGMYHFFLPADDTRNQSQPDNYSMGGPLYILVE